MQVAQPSISITVSNSRNKPGANPFYVLLVVVGTLFALTACAYAVMIYLSWNAFGESQFEGGLMDFMSDHGMTILFIELAILAVFTFAAIGTDEYWRKRKSSDTGEETSSK